MKILTVAFILLFTRETKCLPDTSMTSRRVCVCVWGGGGGGGGLVTFIMHNIPSNISGREIHEADRSQ